MKKILPVLALIFIVLALAYIYHINRVTREEMWGDMMDKTRAQLARQGMR